MKKDEEKPPVEVGHFHTTEVAEAGDGGARSLSDVVVPANRPKPTCPQLMTGSRLDKAVGVLPNHWLKIGRHPKAHLLLNNAGVSRNQCSVRWDTHERKVELRVECETGTLVNGRPFSLDRVMLEHGDRIRILGKGQIFDFIVDLRPVGLGFGDPRQRAREGQKASVAPKQRRDRLRALLVQLNKYVDKAEGDAFRMEKEYYEIQTRRSVRVKELEKMRQEHRFYVEDEARLGKHLEDSRRDWLDRLDKDLVNNEESIKPIILDTADLQDKVEKLQLKKDELARSIHPERYAVADVTVNELEFNPKDDAAGHGSGAEDEEDAFAGLSGLEDNRASGNEASDDEQPMAGAGKATAAKVGSAPAPAGGLKREGGAPAGDDDEPLQPAPKRARPAGEEEGEEARAAGKGPTWVCEDKGATAAGT